MYRILVLDYDECCFAEVMSSGEIIPKFELTSSVPHKHGCGGQSQHRFQQNRKNEIVLWFKRINEYLKGIDGHGVVVGVSPVYRKHFEEYLSSANRAKIKEWRGTEYTNLAGVYQMVGQLEAEKKVRFC
jgi:peptide subunit release factor 1 (eRF1)